MAENTPPHPLPLQRALEMLGADIRDARRRRRIQTRVMAERLFVSLPTLRRLERGDPTAAMGTPNAYVYVDLDGTVHPVGRLWVHAGRQEQHATFEYDATWIQSDVRFALEPAPQLGPGPFHTSGDRALFGALGDSAPDRWGRTLLARRAATTFHHSWNWDGLLKPQNVLPPTARPGRTLISFWLRARLYLVPDPRRRSEARVMNS